MAIEDGSLAVIEIVNVSPGVTVFCETVMEVISGPSLSITTPIDATYVSFLASTPIAVIVCRPLGADVGIWTSCEMEPVIDEVVSPRSIGVEYITSRTFERD